MGCPACKSQKTQEWCFDGDEFITCCVCGAEFKNLEMTSPGEKLNGTEVNIPVKMYVGSIEVSGTEQEHDKKLGCVIIDKVEVYSPALFALKGSWIEGVLKVNVRQDLLEECDGCQQLFAKMFLTKKTDGNKKERKFCNNCLQKLSNPLPKQSKLTPVNLE